MYNLKQSLQWLSQQLIFMYFMENDSLDALINIKSCQMLQVRLLVNKIYSDWFNCSQCFAVQFRVHVHEIQCSRCFHTMILALEHATVMTHNDIMTDKWFEFHILYCKTQWAWNVLAESVLIGVSAPHTNNYPTMQAYFIIRGRFVFIRRNWWGLNYWKTFR